MTQIQHLFEEEKKRINTHLQAIFASYRQELTHVGGTTEETLNRLEAFALRGKGVRGTLCILSARMYESSEGKVSLDIAAALEILHSCLLIHDDIMDNDILRRGQPSVYAQYIENGKAIGACDPLHFARSMGICVGDVGFFMGFDMVTRALPATKISSELLAFLSREFMIVALGQMNDVFFSNNAQMPSKQDIVDVYTYKTARYTFSLPLCLGAKLARKDQQTIDQLGELGEHIGIVFQIRDDEIGLFLNEKEIGKPVASDIRENKKTLGRALFQENLSRTEQREVDAIFVKHEPTDEDINTIKTYMKKYQTDTKLHILMKEHQTQATHLIKKLDIQTADKNTLHELVEYVATRRS
jgi:geranylgeranyl diphosphate synthase type I